jgi:hypothetical protein
VKEHPVEPRARERRQLFERGAPRRVDGRDDPAPGRGDLGVALPLQALVELALAVTRPGNVRVRIDEPRQRGLPPPVEDDVLGEGRLPVEPDVLVVRSDPGQQPALRDERGVLDTTDPSLVGARP